MSLIYMCYNSEKYISSKYPKFDQLESKRYSIRPTDNLHTNYELLSKHIILSQLVIMIYPVKRKIHA